MASAGRRVVVTGLGLLTPLGNSPAELAAALREGRSGMVPVEWEAGPVTGEVPLATVAGRVRPDPETLDAKQRRRLDPFAQYALIAGAAAWEDARRPTVKARRGGVFFGNGFGGMGTFIDQVGTMAERGPRRVSPLFVPAVIPNAAAGHLSHHCGLRGPCLTYTTACAAGTMALGEGFRRVRSGELEVALAGASEAPLLPLAVAGFRQMRALAKDSCRPFAADRDGFLLGEGAAMFVLEEREHALKRRARIYAEVVGYGTAADAHHITEPDPAGRGAEQAVREALRDGAVHPYDLDYVNAHATGTPAGDGVEAAMLARVLGEGAGRTWVSSTKGVMGHLLGAAGAVEAAVTVLALETGLLPANLPTTEPDPACGLRLVAEPGQQAPLGLAMSTSFGFGGVNAALVLAAADLVTDRE